VVVVAVADRAPIVAVVGVIKAAVIKAEVIKAGASKAAVSRVVAIRGVATDAATIVAVETAEDATTAAMHAVGRVAIRPSPRASLPRSPRPHHSRARRPQPSRARSMAAAFESSRPVSGRRVAATSE